MDKTRQFLNAHPVLLVDRNSVPRTYLHRVLLDMGAQPEKLFAAREPKEAEELIRKHSPRTVICDDSVGLEKVMGLIRLQREQNRGAYEQIFFLVSGNTSQAIIGRAAEEEVDGFILKPFTKSEFVRIFNWVTQEKLNPTDYQKQLQMGRDLLFAGAIDEAIACFERAKDLTKDPSMAFFYVGEARKMKKELVGAKSSYQAGVVMNQVHCKCLLGMFDTLVTETKQEEAYEVLKRIVALFPAHPQRLSTAVNMAVKTGNFRDVENYYEFYEAMEKDSHTAELKNQMGSGLAVNGKYHLIKSSPTSAIQSFERAVLTGGGQEKFIDFAIETLLKYGLYDEATAFAQKFAPNRKVKKAA